MTNSVDPDQTAPLGAVCSGSTLFASILKSSVLLGNYLQQTTSAEVIFQMHFFLALLALRDFLNTTLDDRTVIFSSEWQLRVNRESDFLVSKL